MQILHDDWIENPISHLFQGGLAFTMVLCDDTLDEIIQVLILLLSQHSESLIPVQRLITSLSGLCNPIQQIPSLSPSSLSIIILSLPMLLARSSPRARCLPIVGIIIIWEKAGQRGLP